MEKDDTSCDDFVQCVPTKKGHLILYKGYTYVFKGRLQCGAEQWCCSSRQKTENVLPEWVPIYFMKIKQDEQKCNICEMVLHTDEKSMSLLDHIKSNHTDVYDLHRVNPEATVGFRIEFLHLNVLKDDGDPKTQPVIIGEVCEAASEEIAKPISEKDELNTDSQLVVMPVKKKGTRRDSESRKKSWVWKYFDRISSIIYRCTLCDAVLSIKGCNTNNMNRHVRTKHPSVFQAEMTEKKQHDMNSSGEMDPSTIKVELYNDRDLEGQEATSQKQSQRSWIWLYFDRLSSTLAQCKLCQRNICHGGNATGNMNRHLKMIHNKTGHDHMWVWKVFDNTEEDFYSCRICQYRCMKFTDLVKSISSILHHLKLEHGVVSGEQIITSTDSVED